MPTMSIMGLYRWDNTIFDPMDSNLPESIDPEALHAELLAQCAELEILYTDPDFFKIILAGWSSGRAPVWKRMHDALTASYNITENYDRSETWTDTSNGDSTSINKARGYPTDEGMLEQSRNESDGKSSSTHTGRVHGNIGVRSAQELVEQELALADKADLLQFIIKDFKNRFCLLVY